MEKYVTFKTAGAEGGWVTVCLAASHIVAVERTLTQGAILTPQATYKIPPVEAIRIANELLGTTGEGK